MDITEPRNHESECNLDIRDFVASASVRNDAHAIVRLFPEPLPDLHWNMQLRSAWNRKLSVSLKGKNACWRIRQDGIEIAVFPRGSSVQERCQLFGGHWSGTDRLPSEKVCGIFPRVWADEPIAAQVRHPRTTVVSDSPDAKAARQEIAQIFAGQVLKQLVSWANTAASEVNIKLLPTDPSARNYSEELQFNAEIAEQIREKLQTAGQNAHVELAGPRYVMGCKPKIHNLRTGTYLKNAYVADLSHPRYKLRILMEPNIERDSELASTAANDVMEQVKAWYDNKESDSVLHLQLPIAMQESLPLYQLESVAGLYSKELPHVLEEQQHVHSYSAPFSKQVDAVRQQMHSFANSHKCVSWRLDGGELSIER